MLLYLLASVQRQQPVYNTWPFSFCPTPRKTEILTWGSDTNRDTQQEREAKENGWFVTVVTVFRFRRHQENTMQTAFELLYYIPSPASHAEAHPTQSAQPAPHNTGSFLHPLQLARIFTRLHQELFHLPTWPPHHRSFPHLFALLPCCGRSNHIEICISWPRRRKTI
jgi:hypothetical protein